MEELNRSIHLEETQYKAFLQLYKTTGDKSYLQLSMKKKKEYDRLIRERRKLRFRAFRERQERRMVRMVYILSFSFRYLRNKDIYRRTLLLTALLLLFLIPFSSQPSNSQTEVEPAPTENTQVAMDTSTVLDDEQWEQLTVVRSALVQYIKHNHKMPSTLQDLVQPYPNNYLTSIPSWITYRPLPLSIDLADIPASFVMNAIPNPCSCKEVPFEPIEITIAQDTNMLYLSSGERVLRAFPVALGKELTPTPEGEYFINRKVVFEEPDPSYGIRALELSDTRFAIHGTQRIESIGQDVSHGCIRLHNENVEELYRLTSLYTPVEILSSTTLTAPSEPSLSKQKDSPEDLAKETVKGRFTWGG